jgi:integrase
MRENPMRGYEIAREKNPKRPVVTQDHFEAVRAVSDGVQMEIRRDGRRFKVRSYLSEILDLANGTGRRISAVLSLQFADLKLSEGPLGSIEWREDTDKAGKAWLTPISRQVRKAIDRVLAERPGVGTAYLFPSPRNPRRPVSKDLASTWLRNAQKLAGVRSLDGSLWHAYRRKWATERKHLPDTDVAAAGGWSDLISLKTAYQQVDAATLYRVVSEPAELRETGSD